MGTGRTTRNTTHRIGVQAGATLFGAMAHKNVDCAMTTEPTVSALLAAKSAYIKALAGEKGIYNPTGIMPPNGPPTNLKVLSTFNPKVKGKQINLTKTYTDQFVQAAR